jgi:hypothetical protein
LNFHLTTKYLLQHNILKFQSTIKQINTFKHYTKNISLNKYSCTIKVSELKSILIVYKYYTYYKGRYLITVAIDKSKFIYSLTPCSTVKLESLTSSKILKKIRKFYGTKQLLTAFPSDR